MILNKANYLMPPMRYQVVPTGVFAALVGGSTYLSSNVVQVGGTAQTARDLGLALPAAAPGANGGLPTVDASNRVAGVSGSVAGDVAGKVLGGGSSAITAAGARALDAGGNALAVASKQPDNKPAVDASGNASSTLTAAERTAIADALLSRANAVDGKTLQQALQIMAAVLAGKISGAGSGTETFQGLDKTTVRVVVATDAAGNRTDATYS